MSDLGPQIIIFVISMAQITEFTDLLDKLDMYSLSDFNIVLDKKMALDIFTYVKSKNIKESKMFEWFSEIVSKSINGRHLVTKLYRLKTQADKKRGIQKETFLREIFDMPFDTAQVTSKEKSEQSQNTYKNIAGSISKELSDCQKQNLTLKRKIDDVTESRDVKIKKISKYESESKKITNKLNVSTSLLKHVRYSKKNIKNPEQKIII